VASSTYGIHHFTCDITKIFQFPLLSLCILFHPSLAPPVSSSIAHYTIPRYLKILLHIIRKVTISQDNAARYTIHYDCPRHNSNNSKDTAEYHTIHHELSGHCSTLHNQPRSLKSQLHIMQYTMIFQDTDAFYAIHHELSKHCSTLHNKPRSLKTQVLIMKYTTSSHNTASQYTINHDLSRHICILRY
jgi:hypothetical protein